jgi:hypothetical protein
MGIAEAETLAQMFGKKVELAQPPIKDAAGLTSAASRLLKDGVCVLVGGGRAGGRDVVRGREGPQGALPRRRVRRGPAALRVVATVPAGKGAWGVAGAR